MSYIIEPISIFSFVTDPSIKLPRFQRKATWKKEQNFELAISIFQDYPVGVVIVNKEKWAFRCWHAELGNVRKRFDVISKAIQRAKSPYLCDFVYTDEGIVVDGKIYPTTRMRWVEGVTIKDYICKHKNSKSKLLALADNFSKLFFVFYVEFVD